MTKLTVLLFLSLFSASVALKLSRIPQSPVKNNYRHSNPSISRHKERRKSPETIEAEVFQALEAQRRQQQPLRLPPIRECNAALATLGDSDLLRALRLFGKMRRLDMPTLVTYSTLMSRAVKLSKPRVALRLWDLMMDSSVKEVDIKAVNIRMNCFAKLGDVSSAVALLQETKTGSGPDITTPLLPNLVTYNTLLHACQQAGDLETALRISKEIYQPDARTYTSLIATVARKPSSVAGQNDPSMAFSLLREMKNHWRIRPNGMTYSALIDVCGRCQRVDLALKGLRIMLRQKAQEQEHIKEDSEYSLPNEVGAWTAAINACGKLGRITTAMKLFRSMPSFGVEPNTVTCGSLTDSLLREGFTAETLEVLRYMKGKRLVPSEVMYTSLMSRAQQLMEIEFKSDYSGALDTAGAEDKAIELYTELMQSAIDLQPRQLHRAERVTEANNVLVKVFLVFQQMKAAGARPDLTCYNVLLKACARAGDTNHAYDVIKEMKTSFLEPNDVSWRLLVLSAANQNRSDLAVAAWKLGLEYRRKRGHRRAILDADPRTVRWNPSVSTFGTLLSSFINEARYAGDERRSIACYKQVRTIYDKLLGAEKYLGLDRINVMAVLDSTRTMTMVLEAMVGLLDALPSERVELLGSIRPILQLECIAKGVWHSKRDKSLIARAKMLQ